MFSRFFINRPIFASVISILIVVAGAISFFNLPIAQFPEITPPMIQVSAYYPGADPQVVADTVATPIEQEVNGVENMLYMRSTSSSNGAYSLQVTFELGTDIDMASVLVQNRISRAMPKLPEEVQRQGISVKKSTITFVAIVCMYSPDQRYDDLYIANYINLRVKDQIARLKGVGDVMVFPDKDYGMRVWLDPNKLEARGLATGDVIAALADQNVQVAAGQIGQPPAPKGQEFQLTVNVLGRLSDVEQFENIIVKTNPDGRFTRIKDVARIELGGKNYDSFSLQNGAATAVMIIYQMSGANALAVSDLVQRKMEALKKGLPPGLEYKIVYNAADYVRAAISEVIKTLLMAFLLVSIVVFVFLQNWRATLIPAVTIPVALVGTFSVMALLGFSINMVTLFGLVLAIGIVVDDAIVVVENVERNMTEHGLSGKEAAFRAMQEVTGPIIGITPVLMAVFIPAAFFGGVTGQLYRQFSVTIAVTTFFSAINALTLSPALCALLLRPRHGRRNFLFRAFNWLFGGCTRMYTAIVLFGARRVLLLTLFFVAAVGLAGAGLVRIPTGFLPPEDDGLIMVNIQLPDGASLERTRGVIDRLNAILKSTTGVESYTMIGGFSIMSGLGSNVGFSFVNLWPWEKRLKLGLTKDAVMGQLMMKFSAIQEAVVFPFAMPPIPGVGTTGGFEMYLEDQGGKGGPALSQSMGELLRDAYAQPTLSRVFSTYRPTEPTLFVDVDRVKALTLGIPLRGVFMAMQAYLGSAYVNDFNKFGRIWQVKVQADSAFRAEPDDIERLHVRGRDGRMVPLGTLVHVQESLGPPSIERYNMYTAARIVGQAAPGISSGQALQVMEQMAETRLPADMGYEWTGMSFQEKRASSQGGIVFGLAALLVFLLLAAQYESWADPLVVVLTVPLAVLGAAAALMAREMDNNVYTQIGLVLLVGLAAKNAILIVEFARHRRAEGQSIGEAAVEGARLRFRPILMTSFAFILGVLPLVFATGAGASSRQAIGTVVCGGMTGVTLLGVLFTPALFVAIRRVTEWFRGTPSPEK